MFARKLLQQQNQSLEYEVAMIMRFPVSFIYVSEDGERYLYVLSPHPDPQPTPNTSSTKFRRWELE